jgi:hypothetical protein
MHKLSLAIVLASLLAVADSSMAQSRLFDMGSDQSDLRAGFTRVTPKSVYNKDTGFGWKSGAKLKAHFLPYSREWKTDEGRGRTMPPPIYANEITCDAVFSDQPAAFQVDVPPGEYAVWFVSGRGSRSGSDYYRFDVSVAGDRTTVTIPGDRIFEKRVLHTKVEQGPLTVELTPKTTWLLAALIVYPVADEVKVRSEILDPLEREIYFLPPDVAEKWKDTTPTDDRPMPELTAADKSRGYALFARHWSEPIYPYTVPRADELNPELKAFASLGEYEPVTFTVRPLRDLPGTAVTAGDLRCGQATIPGASVDVRVVRYLRARPNYSSYFTYHIVPDVLEQRDQVDLRANSNQTYWITVHVPQDAKAGVYEGSVTFKPAAGTPAQVPFKLRVLPIRLRTNPEHIYGMYYRDPLHEINPKNPAIANEYFQRKAELERQDMLEHGMNCHISAVRGMTRDDQGNWTIDGDAMETTIALDRKYNLAGKPLVVSFPVSSAYVKHVDRRGMGSHMRLVPETVPESFYAEITKIVEVIEKERKRRGWPEFLYYPIDEPSTDAKAVRMMAGTLAAIKRVPGVRTYVTADPSHEGFAPMWPYVDVWCCQPFVFGYDKIKQLSREKKIEFWCYPNHISGENDHTPVRGARMTWGFGFWRSGFKALIPWIYQSSNGDPWNYLDSSSMDFFNRSTPDGEPIPVTLWEASREGVDDGQYIYTLEQLVAEAKGRGGATAQLAVEAERELKWVWDSIQVQEKYKYDGLWNGADFDAYRWLMASKILRLQEAVGEKR